MKSKKILLGVLNGSFLSSFVGGGKSLFNFFGQFEKKSFGNPEILPYISIIILFVRNNLLYNMILVSKNLKTLVTSLMISLMFK